MNAPWFEVRLLARPNRFRVRVSWNRQELNAFLPNPGRLQELLRPGSPLRLVPKEGVGRRTRFDVLAVRHGGEWVCLDTRLANAAVGEALEARSLPEFARYRIIRSEVPWHTSRFDFRLEDPGLCWLEVKSCSLVQAGRALFPDAPTCRGVRHLQELTRLARSGAATAVLFVVVRRSARFSPNDATDPDFGVALRKADAAGVEIVARQASLRGLRLSLGGRVPIDL